MREIEIQTQIDIAAPPSVVWHALADFSGFPEWNPMVTSADGSAREGSTATLHYRSSVGVPLRFRVRISRCETERELRWVGRRFGTSGDHYFQVLANEGGTHFVHGEVFRGLLAGPLGFMFRNQVPVFEAFNLALKGISEHRTLSAAAAPGGGTAPG